MYGTPTPVLDGNTPTGDCIPPSFSIDELYTTDGDCPVGFTKACATGGTRRGEPVSTVTCCPSITDNIFSLMCKDNEYGCHATATRGVVWTGRVTDIGLEEPTDEPITRTPTTDEGIEAWGIKFLQISSTSSTEITTTTEPASTAEEDRPRDTTFTDESSSETSQADAKGSSDALSGGTAAGIAVGCAAAVGLLGLGAFLFYRKRKRAERVANAQTIVSSSVSAPDDKYGPPRLHPQRKPVPAEMWSGPGQRSDQAWELP